MHAHRGPVAFEGCVWRFADTSGGRGGKPDTERGPSVGDERLPIADGCDGDPEARWGDPREISDVPSFIRATVR